ncbi:MAG: hypothetical protein ACRC1K_17895 [Planctomycetia bacterium]
MDSEPAPVPAQVEAVDAVVEWMIDLAYSRDRNALLTVDGRTTAVAPLVETILEKLSSPVGSERFQAGLADARRLRNDYWTATRIRWTDESWPDFPVPPFGGADDPPPARPR